MQSDDLLTGGWSVPGVNGPVEWSTAFARQWSARTDQDAGVDMQLRAYQLEQVDPLGRSDGDFRVIRGGAHSTFARLLRSANRAAKSA